MNARRWLRRLALAPVIGVLALTLPWSTGPANAYAVPVVPVLGGGVIEWLGVGATVGTAGSVGAAGVTVATGVGAYQGTCQTLQWIVPGDTECDAQAAFGLLMSGDWAGAGMATYTGAAGIIGHDDWAPPPATPEVRVFAGVQGASTGEYTDTWTLRTLSNGTWSNPCAITFDRSGVLEGHTVVVPNGNDGNSIKAAYNAKFAELRPNFPPNFYGTSGTCGGGLGNTHLISVNTRKDGAQTPDATYTTGAGPTTPHVLTVTETCRAPNGTTFQRSGTVTFSPIAGQASPKITLPNCWDIEPGSVRTTVGTELTRQGGPTVQTTTETAVDPERYPNCVGTQCELTPKYVPTGTRCHSGPTDTTPAEDCVDQWPNAGSNTPDWQCYYGEYRVAMSICYKAYPPTYYVDSVPGDPKSEPNPNPSAPPTTAPIPTTGPNPVGPPGGETANDPEGAPESTGCWGSSWSFNPFSWVYTPMKCLLKWAYLPPSGSLQSELDVLRTQATTRAPWSVIVGLGEAAVGVANGYASAGGCGLLADFTTDDIAAPITCAQIRAVPGYGGLYALVSAGIYAATALALYRLFATYFESNG